MGPPTAGRSFSPRRCTRGTPINLACIAASVLAAAQAVLVGAQRVDFAVAHPLQFGLFHLHRDGLGRADASGIPKILLHQRTGMPYCRPPFVHCAF